MSDHAPASASPLPPPPSPLALRVAQELVTRHRLRLADARDQRLGELAGQFELSAAAWAGPRAALVGLFQPEPDGQALTRRCAAALRWGEQRLVDQKADRCDLLLIALAPVKAAEIPRSDDPRVHLGVVWVDVPSGSAEALTPIPRGMPAVKDLREQARRVRDGAEAPTLAAVDLAERQTMAGGYVQPVRTALVSTPVVTYCLIGVFIAIYVAERSLTSVSIIDFGAIVTIQPFRSDWWRYISSAFLHSPALVLHVFFNSVAMFYIGRYVEQLYGRLVLLGTFVTTAVAGNVLWVVVSGDGRSLGVSLGASGGICGLMGLLVLLGHVQGKDVPPGIARSLRQYVIFGMVSTLVFGFIATSVNNLAHIGGFAAGALLSLVLPPMVQVGGRPLRIHERVLLVLVVGATMVALGIAGYHVGYALAHPPAV